MIELVGASNHGRANFVGGGRYHFDRVSWRLV